MASSSTVTPPLDSSIVRIAFQIYAFIEATGRAYLREISHDTGLTVEYIHQHYPRPEQIGTTAATARTSRRSSAEPPDFPPNWATSIPTFRRSVQAFSDRTYDYRSLPQVAEYLRQHRLKETISTQAPGQERARLPHTSQDTMADGNANAAAVDPALLAAIQQIVQTSMQGMMQAMRTPAAAAAQDAAEGSAVRTGKLRAEDLGYFDPDYESERNESIVSSGRHVYYRDMFVWIDHLKDLAKNHSEEELRPLITQAFRGGALIWYSTELSELEKDLLREASMDRWYQAFTRRFRQKGPEAQEALDSCSYSLQDAKNGRTPRSYVQDIIRHAKATQLPLYNQLLLAYTKMHYKFRVHLTEPLPTTTLSSFLEQLDVKANAFYDIARDELGAGRQHSSASQQQLSRIRGKQGQYQSLQSNRQSEIGRQVPYRPFVPSSQGQYYSSYRAGQPPFQGYQRPFYPYPNYNNNQPQSSQQALVPTYRPLQQPPNQGYGLPNYPNRNGYQARPPQGEYIKQEQAQGPRYPQAPGKGFAGNNRPRAAAYQGTDESEEAAPTDDVSDHEEDREPEEGFHGDDELTYYYPRDDEPYSEAYIANPIIARSFTCRRCHAEFCSKNPQHDQWRTRAQLANASELIKDYEEWIRTMRNEKAQRLGLRLRWIL